MKSVKKAKKPAIVTKLRLGLEIVEGAVAEKLHGLMRVQQSAFRFAYNLFHDGEDGKQVYHILRARFPQLDSWEASSIRNEASGVIRSQEELLPVYRDLFLKKKENAIERLVRQAKVIEKSKAKKAKLASETPRQAERIKKLEEKIKQYEMYKKSTTEHLRLVEKNWGE
jgi:hypothetical protein